MRALDLYEKGKVKQFKRDYHGFSALVSGTKPYEVSVSNQYYDQGNCQCYLGQNDTLCKHMVVVAIYAVMDGKKLSNEDKKISLSPVCSNRLGNLEKGELSIIKKSIIASLEYTKLEPACIKTFKELTGRETCFGWEEPLWEISEKK